MTYLKAALTVLRESQRPLTSREIAERAMAEGLIVTSGKTPEATMSAALYTHIAKGAPRKMAAIVGYILDERFSDPAISELVVTSDGFVLAQTEDEVGANDMIGEETDLNRNLLTLIEAAGLTEEEVREFGRLQRERIRRY